MKISFKNWALATILLVIPNCAFATMIDNGVNTSTHASIAVTNGTVVEVLLPRTNRAEYLICSDQLINCRWGTPQPQAAPSPVPTTGTGSSGNGFQIGPSSTSGLLCIGDSQLPLRDINDEVDCIASTATSAIVRTLETLSDQ